MKWSAEVIGLVPVPVVTVTSTWPALPAGLVQVIWVPSPLTDTPVAGLDAPKLTAVVPVRLVPVMVTEVPPAVGPEDGLTAVTVGAPAAT